MLLLNKRKICKYNTYYGSHVIFFIYQNRYTTEKRILWEIKLRRVIPEYKMESVLYNNLWMLQKITCELKGYMR